jgi:hypothetical protein
MIQIIRDDGFNVLGRNAGLIDEDERFGRVSFGENEGAAKSKRAAANDGDGENPPVGAENSTHFRKCDFTVSNHMISCLVQGSGRYGHESADKACKKFTNPGGILSTPPSSEDAFEAAGSLEVSVLQSIRYRICRALQKRISDANHGGMWK